MVSFSSLCLHPEALRFFYRWNSTKWSKMCHLDNSRAVALTKHCCSAFLYTCCIQSIGSRAVGIYGRVPVRTQTHCCAVWTCTYDLYLKIYTYLKQNIIPGSQRALWRVSCSPDVKSWQESLSSPLWLNKTKWDVFSCSEVLRLFLKSWLRLFNR